MLTLTMRRTYGPYAPTVSTWLNLPKETLAALGDLPAGVDTDWFAEEIPVALVTAVMN